MKTRMCSETSIPIDWLRKIQAVRSTLLLVLLGVVLTSCGGGGSSGAPTDDGPIIVGTGITERALSRQVLDVKSASGEKSSVAITSTGNFNDAIEGTGPFLSRLDLGNNEYLYGIGYADANQRVRQNVHSYSDLVVRNWFASRNRNLDAEFDSTAPVTMPPEGEIDEIVQNVVSIVALVMDDYGVAGADLLAGSATTAFNTFILQNPVIINIVNNNITIIVNDDPNGNGTQSVATDDLPLDTDLAAEDTESPTAPADLRAIAASNTEIVLVWTPSTDNVGVAAYRVFRDGVDVGETPYPVFVDTVATGLSPIYTVVAVDGAGNVSLSSEEVTGMTETVIDTTPPPTPLAVVLTSTVNSINISWQQTEIADVAGFRVLGALVDNEVELRATVTSTFMTDADVASGLEYCYQVVAVDASQNESAPTELQCVTVGGSVVTTEPPPVGNSDTQISFSAATYAITENSPSVELTVQRTGSAVGEVSVDYAATGGTAVDGEDFTATSGTLQWSDGQTAAKTITVQIASDTDNTEGDETFTVALSNLSSNASFGDFDEATVTISDVASAECTTELETVLITVDTTLNLPCYLVNGNLDVREPAQLTLQPGVTLKFASGRELIVRTGASLNAVGTAANPVVLTAQDPSPGFWDGVYFVSSNSSQNVLEHLVIEYGGGNSLASNLTFSNSRVAVTNVTTRHSAEYGFSIDANSTLTSFDAVTSTANVVAGVTGPSQAGSIAANGVFTGNDEDVVEVRQSVVDEDTDWVDIGVPWRVNGLDVRAGMTISEGTELEFETGTEVVVRSTGQLTVNGTAEAPVVLTGKEKTPGSWDGVYLVNASGAASAFNNAVIEYGGANNFEANFYTSNASRFSLDNVVLRNSSGYGFNIGANAAITQFNNVTSVNNDRSGIIDVNLVGDIGQNASLSANTNDGLELGGSILDDDQTWPMLDVPIVHDGIDVRAALTLSAGTTLTANSDSEIIVRSGGSLRSVGTVDDNIVFTAEQAIKGYWKGIYFVSANSTNNVFEYSVVEYGGFGDTSGNLRSNCGSTPIPVYTISNSNLDNSGGYGQYIGSNCNPVIGENVTYMGNVNGPTNLP